MSKHTPGPWSVETVPTSIGICHKIMPIKACLYVDGGSLGGRDLGDQEHLANAAVLASAPDLLAALRALVVWDDHTHPDHEAMAEEWYERMVAREEQPTHESVRAALLVAARAAIAKAQVRS